MTQQELMECSNETLVLWGTQVRKEMDRRKIGGVAVPLHPGNVQGGKPVPAIARVVAKLIALPPSCLSKVESLVDGLVSGEILRTAIEKNEAR